MLLGSEEAEGLARAWIARWARPPGDAPALRRIIAKPYGWVFVFTDLGGIGGGRTPNGSAPEAGLLVDRLTRDVIAVGLARPMDADVSEYEGTLPRFRTALFSMGATGHGRGRAGAGQAEGDVAG